MSTSCRTRRSISFALLLLVATGAVHGDPRIGTVVSDGSRLREKPDTGAGILTLLNSGERVEYVAQSDEQNGDFQWFLVRVLSTKAQGWIYGELVRFDDQSQAPSFRFRAASFEDAVVRLPSGIEVVVGQSVSELRARLGGQISESPFDDERTSLVSPSLGGVDVYYSKLTGRISNIVITQPEAELSTGIRVGADIRDVLKANGVSRLPTENSYFQLRYGNRSRSYDAALLLEPDANGLIKRIDIGNPVAR